MLKKAQSEDIFNDLIPAIILIIITVIIIAINGAAEERDISETSGLDLASLRRIDLFTYLRMPIQGYSQLSELIIDLDAGENKAIATTESVDPYSCNEDLASELRENIGNSYKQWSLRVFNVASGRLLFQCYSDDDFFTDAYRLASVDVQEAQFGSTMYLDFEQAYFSPFGMKYINATLPSSDPNKNLFVKMGVMLDE